MSLPSYPSEHCIPEECPSVLDAKQVTEILKVETNVLVRGLSDLEARHTELVRSVDAKLDKLMGLTNIVASLQERMIHQADDLSEVRGSLKEMDKNIREGLEKADDRIRKVSEDLGEKITSFNKEIKAQIDSVQKHVGEVEATSSKWINRITGGVAVLAVVVGVIQWFVLDYISSARHREDEYKARIAELERKSIQVEIDMAKNQATLVTPTKAAR